MALNLYIAWAALFVAAFSSLLGLWMNRDQQKPPRYAYVFSALIVLATLVNLGKAWVDFKNNQTLREDIARILETLDTLAQESDNAELASFVGGELNAQSRSNPDVVDRFARRVHDKGGNAEDALNRNLPPADRARFSGAGKAGGKKASGARKNKQNTAPKASSEKSDGDKAGAEKAGAEKAAEQGQAESKGRKGGKAGKGKGGR